jgi:hypothetical protein
MPTLQAIHGRIVEVRRYTNVHLYSAAVRSGRPTATNCGSSRPGAERKFTINTRIMPARRGHEVSLIVTAHKVPQVLGLANWSTIDGVNYARTDAPPLVRARDFVVLVAAFLAAAILSEISAWCCSFRRRWRTCRRRPSGGLWRGRGGLPRWTGLSMRRRSGRADLCRRCNDHPLWQPGQAGLAIASG